MTPPKPKAGARPKSRFRPKPVRRSEEGRRILREQEELRRQRIREQEQEEATRRLRSNDRHLLFYVYGKRLGHIVSRCSRLATKRSSRRHVVTSHLSRWLGSHRRTKPKTRWVPTNTTVHQSYHAPGMPPASSKTPELTTCLDYPTPRVRFPELKGCMTHLMNKLTQDEVEDAKFMEYHVLIAQLNSHNITTDALISEAMAQFVPEILELQGKDLSPETFVAVQQKQLLRGAPWPQAGGYVDGVVDDRNTDYIRFYCGQSSRLPVRIAVEHAGEIRNGNEDTLHYYVLARGRGHRYARFLQLWTAPPLVLPGNSTPEDAMLTTARFHLVQNVLEMTVCRAFESLPGRVLANFFGPANYSNVGLNNLPPLFEGRDVPAFVRRKYAEYHQQSPDPDISGFADVRKAQLVAKRNTRGRPAALLKRDYLQALEQLMEEAGLDPRSLANFSEPLAVCDTGLVKINAELQALEAQAAIAQWPQRSTPLIAPRGSFRARIGIVISSEAIGMKTDELGVQVHPLDGFGLTKVNSLIWTSSLQGIGSGPSMFEPFSDQRAHINRLNYSIIMKGNLRVMVLCGLQAQRDILSAFQNRDQLLGPYPLSLRDASHSVWLVTEPEKKVGKVLIASPEPLARSFLRDVSKLRQIRDVFGLVRALTGESIKHNCWENACFFAALFAQRRREREEGAERLTVASLGLVYRDWLQYRGFVDDEDIKELERISGNLTLGLMWITGFLANRRKRGDGDGASVTRDRGYRGIYDVEAYKKTRMLFDRVYEKRLAAVSAFHSGRRNDGNHHTVTDEVAQEEGTSIIEDGLWVSRRYDDGDEREITNDVMVKFVGDLESEVNTDERDDEVVSDGGFLFGQRPALPHGASQQRDSAQVERSVWKSPVTLASLKGLMTESGVEQMATRRAGYHSWRLQVCYSLVSFVAYGDFGDIPDAPRFALRANLSKVGTPHPNCIYPNYHGCISSDPCVRLALQYRLLNGNEGEGWHWAEVGEGGLRYNSGIAERVSKANTLVDLLEGKAVQELEGVPRRSLIRWMYNSNAAVGSTKEEKEAKAEGTVSLANSSY